MVIFALVVILQAQTPGWEPVDDPFLFRNYPLMSGKIAFDQRPFPIVSIQIEDFNGVVSRTKSRSDGTFRIEVPYAGRYGQYWITVNDPRFHLVHQRLIVRDAQDLGRTITVILQLTTPKK